jgi:hypothetical protein
MADTRDLVRVAGSSDNPRMQYQGWNFEKTLLVSSPAGPRTHQHVDVCIPVDSRSAGSLERDVRVILKKDWNQLDREIPSQVYQVSQHGGVTTCRVAFTMDVPAQDAQRVGVYYDNPAAAPPAYQSPLDVRGNGLGYIVKTPHYTVETDPATGQIKTIDGRFSVPSSDARFIRYTDLLQEGAAVTFAVEDGRDVGPARASAAKWTEPEIVEDVRGPVFFKQTRRGKLMYPGCQRPELCPDLDICYKFFAHQPYFLVYTRLSFPADTKVFAIYTGMLAVNRARYTHYTFRPVSANLPDTDMEEMGHILVDPAHTADLPHGSAFSDLLPYDLAWHAFINVKHGSAHAISCIQLHQAAGPAAVSFPFYRSATYLMRDETTLCGLRAPVYVAVRNRSENAVTIPAGTVLENLDAIACDLFDRDWGNRTDDLGRKLNTPVRVDVHPRLMAGPVPPEPFEPLPCGARGDAYRRFGVR